MTAARPPRPNRRPPRRPTGSAPAGAAHAPASALRVRVRMYRQGFGDCFLLTFQKGGAETHMLIDCGVHKQHPGGAARIVKVVDHVKKSTSNGTLAALAVTHEHWDHVAGFSHALGTFKTFTISQHWSAWTEDPRDTLANSLREQYAKAKKAVALALDQLGAARGNGDQSTTRAGLVGLAGFSGLAVAGDGEGGKTVRDAMEWASQPGTGLHHRPFARPHDIPGVDGVRVFVLGPPRDEAVLRSDDPRSGEGYALAPLAGLADSLIDTLQGNGAPRSTFAREHWQPGAGARQPDSSYTNKENDWRRIDQAWMSSTEQLALAMDSHTNNTSLVLAIQLPRSGKVLLFPGDAQAGNWRSWHDKPFDGTATTARDLLANTVLYKVSHHGSKNATLKTMGLELMTRPNLTAMLPLYMKPLGEGWGMPGEKLYADLIRRTQGRIIWADPDEPAALHDQRLAALGASKAAFEKSVTQDDLYAEYTVVDA